MVNNVLIKLTFLGDIVRDVSQLGIFKIKTAVYNFDSVFSEAKNCLQSSGYVADRLTAPLGAKKRPNNIPLYDLTAAAREKTQKDSLVNDSNLIIEAVTRTRLSPVMKEYTIG